MNNEALLEKTKEIRARNAVNWIRFVELAIAQVPQKANALMREIEMCEEAIALEMENLIRWGEAFEGQQASNNELNSINFIEQSREVNNAAWLAIVRTAYHICPAEARATMKAIAECDDHIRALRKEVKP